MHLMLVHGAIVPPRAVLEALDEVVRSVPAPVGRASEAAPQGRRLLGGLGRRRTDPVETPDVPPMLEHVPIEDMRFPVTGFGNLTTNDARAVANAIAEAAAEWPAPTVRFAGGTALDFPGDWSVWAKLEGDVDELMEVGRGVPQAVERLGFFVDRRKFRPMLSVATVTTSTTGPFLQQVVDALEAFRGESWTVDISVLKESFIDGRTVLSEYQRIPLVG
jgi:2'-5' RNA ligase